MKKSKFAILLSLVCAFALTLSLGLTAFAADEATAPALTGYAATFEKIFNGTTTAADMVITQYDQDTTGADGVTVPAGSIELNMCTKNSSDVNMYMTKTKVLNMKKPVIIKWRENFTGDMAAYHIGVCSDNTMRNPMTQMELSFSQGWGSVYNGGGTMKTTFRHKGTEVGAFDMADFETNRSAYRYYQIKIVYNAETNKFDVTMAVEGHDGSGRHVSETPLSVDADATLLSGGGYLFFYGNSHNGGAQPHITLINDERNGHTEGTNFGDWFHSETVTNLTEFKAALADTSVSTVECVVSGNFQYIDEPITVDRSVVIRSVSSAGAEGHLGGTGGLVFEKPFTVSGSGVACEMWGGAVRTLVVDGAYAYAFQVSLGYTADMASDKPDHCVVVKNGGEAVAEWSSLDISGNGAVRLSGGSTFQAKGNAGDIWKETSLVDLGVSYPTAPVWFADTNHYARVYAVVDDADTDLLKGFTKDFVNVPVTVKDENNEDKNVIFIVEYSPITEFEFEPDTVSVAEGGSVTLGLKSITPEAPTNVGAFACEVEDNEIADVTFLKSSISFKVVGKKAGTTKVTLKTTDRESAENAVTQEITVTVREPVENGFVVDSSKVAKTISAGTDLDLSALVVSATFDNNTKTALASDKYTVNLGDFDKNKVGEYTVTVTYKEYTAQSFTVKVTEKQEGGNGEGDEEGCGCSSSVAGYASLALAGAVLILALAAVAVKKARTEK